MRWCVWMLATCAWGDAIAVNGSGYIECDLQNHNGSSVIQFASEDETVRFSGGRNLRMGCPLLVPMDQISLQDLAYWGSGQIGELEGDAEILGATLAVLGPGGTGDPVASIAIEFYPTIINESVVWYGDYGVSANISLSATMPVGWLIDPISPPDIHTPEPSAMWLMGLLISSGWLLRQRGVAAWLRRGRSCRTP
jgi:hypothetical protein